jgi:hypothetical protein
LNVQPPDNVALLFDDLFGEVATEDLSRIDPDDITVTERR